jgi:hypothetical protein
MVSKVPSPPGGGRRVIGFHQAALRLQQLQLQQEAPWGDAFIVGLATKIWLVGWNHGIL